MNYNAYTKLKPEAHIYSKSKSECIEIPTYQCIVSKILSKNFADWASWSKKCIPSGLTKIFNFKAPQCNTHEEDDNALWNMDAEGFLYKYKCPKPCSILEYSGKLDYWEPKNDHGNPNNTFIINLRFQYPEVTKVYEEYLIYDFNGMLGSIGGTLGLFVGFSFSSAIELFINLLKRCKLEKYN